MKKFCLAILLGSAASCPSTEGGKQKCIPLSSGPAFILNVFLAVGESPSPVLASSPCFLQPKSSAGLSLCCLCRSPVGKCSSAVALWGWQKIKLPEAARLFLCLQWLLGHRAERWMGAGLSPAWLAGARVDVCRSTKRRVHSAFKMKEKASNQGLTAYLGVCFSWCLELSLLHVFGNSWQSLGPSAPSPHCSVLLFSCSAVP